MSLDVMQKINDLDRRIEVLKAQYQQAQGERSAVRTRLSDEFSIKNGKQAAAMLEEMEAAAATLRTQLENLLRDVTIRVEAIENALK